MNELREKAERIAINLTNTTLSERIETVFAILYAQQLTHDSELKRVEIEARIDELEHITGYSEARGICTNASFPLEMNTEPIGDRLATLKPESNKEEPGK